MKCLLVQKIEMNTPCIIRPNNQATKQPSNQATKQILTNSYISSIQLLPMLKKIDLTNLYRSVKEIYHYNCHGNESIRIVLDDCSHFMGGARGNPLNYENEKVKKVIAFIKEIRPDIEIVM